MGGSALARKHNASTTSAAACVVFSLDVLSGAWCVVSGGGGGGGGGGGVTSAVVAGLVGGEGVNHSCSSCSMDTPSYLSYLFPRAAAGVISMATVRRRLSGE